jgi:hypothetical protein
MSMPASPSTSHGTTGPGNERVVYLLGAGATQGCIAHVGGRQNLLMRELAEPISEALRVSVSSAHPGMLRLINDVVMSGSPNLDFEQLITFLEDSPSLDYREFSNQVRNVFSSVLRDELDKAETQFGTKCSELYAALVDMHEIAGSGESLSGFLTLNYDVLLEQAIDRLDMTVDYGVTTTKGASTRKAVKVLKMHGSFGWAQEWPITAELRNSPGFWIPPGIRKPKNEYPFNAIWGSARELLDCDVLRIIGCSLGANDWDLVSLLFSTRHTHATARPYRIEVISSYGTAARIRDAFPYLDVLSLPELPKVGEHIVSEALGIAPTPYSTLSDNQREEVVDKLKSPRNSFQYWLTQMSDAIMRDLGDLSTRFNVFREFAEGVGSP